LKFYGDFSGYGKLSEFERHLIGHRRERSEVKDVLDKIDVNHYFYGIEKEALLDLLI
jgi:lipoate---protein ligase